MTAPLVSPAATQFNLQSSQTAAILTALSCDVKTFLACFHLLISGNQVC